MAATILCVDVDRQLLHILGKTFGDAGYRALLAHDGEQALEVVREESPALVVLDITIPKRDGFGVLEEIRALPAPVCDTPVLLTCGSRLTPQYEERARKLGAQALLTKPVALEDFLSRVREFVKPDPAPAGEQTRGRQKGPCVEGDLAEVPFPDLLHRLHGLRATGVLMITRGKKKKAIQMRDGYPVAVKSNLVNECLGNYLVRNGAVTRETLLESLDRMKKGEGLQGQILVAMDVLTEDEITTALREQAEDKLFEIFEWKRGRFKLEIGSRLKRGNALTLEMSPANLILQGVRRVSLARLDAWMAKHLDRQVARSESPFHRFQDVELNSAEQALIEQLDGTRTLRDLARDDEAMRRTLCGLLAMELLELRGSPAEGEPAMALPKPGVSPAAQIGPSRSTADDRKLRIELAATAERLRGKSHFEMLGVSEDAGEEAVERAYEKLAKQAHPDRFQNASTALRQMAEEVFQLVSSAHETISDPKRRKEYIASRAMGQKNAVQRTQNERAVQAEVEFQLGESLLRRRDYEKALEHFKRAREAAPRAGEYLAHYGWCLHLCNPDNATVVQEAIAHVRRAVALARDEEKPYLFLGRLCKVVGDSKGAEKMFTRAVQLRPDCVEGMRELRLINMRRGKGRGLIGRLLRR